MLSLPPWTLRQLPDGNIVAEHPGLAVPVTIPTAMLVRIIKAAVRASLEGMKGKQ